LKRLGKDTWRAAVSDSASMLIIAFSADYLVLGGGNSKIMRKLPANVRRGNNLTAFRGGMRLWNLDDIPTQTAHGVMPNAVALPSDWRVI
jgi:hypothetical protein